MNVFSVGTGARPFGVCVAHIAKINGLLPKQIRWQPICKWPVIEHTNSTPSEKWLCISRINVVALHTTIPGYLLCVRCILLTTLGFCLLFLLLFQKQRKLALFDNWFTSLILSFKCAFHTFWRTVSSIIYFKCK